MIGIKWVLINIAICCSVLAVAQSNNEGKTVYLECNDKPLRLVIDELRKQSEINFIFSDNLIVNASITCNFQGKKVTDALDIILADSDITYRLFRENYIVLYARKKVKREEYKTVVVEKENPYFDTSYVVVKPVLVSKHELNYPEAAIEGRMEGDVTLRLLISDSGSVWRATVDSSSGYMILDSATVKYAQNLKFSPATLNGKSLTVWMSMTFKYYIIEE